MGPSVASRYKALGPSPREGLETFQLLHTYPPTAVPNSDGSLRELHCSSRLSASTIYMQSRMFGSPVICGEVRGAPAYKRAAIPPDSSIAKVA
jgi:hypothetical protein